MLARTAWLFSFCLLVAGLLSGPSPALAQESGDNGPAGPAVAFADSDESRRQAVLDVLERPEVRNAVRAAGVDLDEFTAGIEQLEGEPLARAARQAEELNRRLAIDGTISSTTLIILLIATVLIIVLVQA
ncbi:MAG: hypothetical protein ACREMD_05455 [Gemmatimonadota bacterium]